MQDEWYVFHEEIYVGAIRLQKRHRGLYKTSNVIYNLIWLKKIQKSLVYDHQRTPYYFTSGGPDLYTSEDAGQIY